MGMANSASSKPEKRLGEFLKEQQEPFILDVYLLERGYSKKWTPIQEDSSNKKSTAKKRKGSLFPFCKVLTALHKKLAFHHIQCCSDVIKVSKSNTINVEQHVSVSVHHEAAGNYDQTDRFSTASSSTVFNSCSDIDEDGDGVSLSSSYQDMDTFQASTFCNKVVQSQQATIYGKHRQRCIEVSVMNETLKQDDDSGAEHRRSVHMPKKITEDSLLSAALWSSLIHTAKTENYTKELQEFLGPKRVLHKTNQLLFDCVSEITINLPRQKGYKLQRGPEELGKILWKRTKQASNETNLNKLDFLDSMNEWSSEFTKQIKAISVEIADEILEGVKNEIVSEIIEMSTTIL